MNRYRVTALLTISVSTVVEANTREEAKERALEHQPIGLCHQCGGSRDEDDSWVTSGELDGIPENLIVEEQG